MTLELSRLYKEAVAKAVPKAVAENCQNVSLFHPTTYVSPSIWFIIDDSDFAIFCI